MQQKQEGQVGKYIFENDDIFLSSTQIKVLGPYKKYCRFSNF